LEFDLITRYVDNLPAIGISSYATLDARLAWKPKRNLEWAIVGRNLLDSHHAEFSDALAGTIGTEVQRELYTTLTWTY
jgi:iron complex outermembrane receptor protein